MVVEIQGVKHPKRDASDSKKKKKKRMVYHLVIDKKTTNNKMPLDGDTIEVYIPASSPDPNYQIADEMELEGE